MPAVPVRLASLVRRRLARFLRQDSEHYHAISVSQTTRQITRVVRQNLTSGRYDRFRENANSKPRLSLTAYVDRVIPIWIQEAPHWNKLQQHDKATWEQLCQWLTHAAEKWFGRQRSLRGHTAEDFAQQAIILMLKAQYPFDVPFVPWALTILHRQIWGQVRLSKDLIDIPSESLNELSYHANSDGTGIEKQVADPLAHAFIQAQQDRDELWRALSKLKPTLAQVIDLFFFEGLTDEEIARKMNTSRGNIQTRRHRALKRLYYILTNPEASEKPRHLH